MKINTGAEPNTVLLNIWNKIKDVYNAQCQKLTSIQILAGVCDQSYPITIDTLKQEYSDVFTGLWCFPGKYHKEIQPGASPVTDHPRRVLWALYAPFRDKLNKLEHEGMLDSLVITEKRDGLLRPCLDPEELNKNIRKGHFQIRTFTDVMTQLGDAKVITILDQKDSYW